MEIHLSVLNGTLALTSEINVCSEEALEGPSISFQGSRYSIDHALSGLVYWVRSRPVVSMLGYCRQRLIACMSLQQITRQSVVSCDATLMTLWSLSPG